MNWVPGGSGEERFLQEDEEPGGGRDCGVLGTYLPSCLPTPL